MVSGAASPNNRGLADPDGIHTPNEFTMGLAALRGDRSYSDLIRTAKTLPPYDGRQPTLPRSTLSDLLNGKSVPGRETLITFLIVCGVDDAERQAWLGAWERVSTGHLRRPVGAVRVRETDARRLGVHASIQVDPAAADLPLYVPRDVDADLRTAITAAGDRGGFVLVEGSSSVGKTRALFEAVRAVLPEWWLLHPGDAAAIRELAAAPPVRTVVWLDELQRYLNHPGGLPVGAVRALLDSGGVLVATLWPDEYGKRAALRTAGQSDPYDNDRELIGLARVIDVSDTFSDAERRRAGDLSVDGRIRVALGTSDAGFTQVLAAGPELIRWWERADVTDVRQCYGKAVITAALDARRVGAHAPLTSEFLIAAAPAYLTSSQQAAAPADWFKQAIDYATTRLHGASSCLSPVATGMGRIAGWVTADYLHQHAHRVRRSQPVPDQVWLALTTDHHSDEGLRVAEGAEHRGRPQHAEALYRQRADAGDPSAAWRLSKVLAKQNRVDELRQRAAGGDRYAAWWLGDLLATQGRAEEAIAAWRPCVEAGDGYVIGRVVSLLTGQGRAAEAIAVLRQRSDGGDQGAAWRLAGLLVGQGRVDELRDRADAGDRYAVWGLVGLLTKQHRVNEAIAVLRQRADVGDQGAAWLLGGLLVQQGQTRELQERADTNDRHAALRLGDLLARQGQAEKAIAVWRRCIEAGDLRAPARLASLLVGLTRVDEAIAVLGPSADAGDWYAAVRLAGLLAEQGRVDELRDRADAGDRYAAVRLAGLLAEQGRVDELRDRADAGDRYATRELVNRLTAQGQVDEAIDVTRRRANAGDWHAIELLVGLLTRKGRAEEAIAVLKQQADKGDQGAARWLGELLAGQGRVDEAIAVLRRHLTAKDSGISRQMAELLLGQGRADEAIEVLRQRNDIDTTERLFALLVEQGRVGELEEEVAAGTPGAVERLAELRRGSS